MIVSFEKVAQNITILSHIIHTYLMRNSIKKNKQNKLFVSYSSYSQALL